MRFFLGLVVKHAQTKAGLPGSRFAILLPVLSALWACAVWTPLPATTGFTSEQAVEVFAAGYDSISEYYIDRVELPSLALHGMEGLHKIDPDLNVVRADSKLTLAVGRAQIGEFNVPQSNDPSRWARLTASVVAAGRSASQPLRDALPEQVYKAIFDAELAGLDPFSRYASADRARDNRANRDGFGGIGITLAVDEDGIAVASVLAGTPAEAQGLRVGDRILFVDDEPLTGMPVSDVLARLRGAVGSTLNLTIERDSKRQIVALSRARIVPTTVTVKREGEAVIIRITGFNQGTARQVEEAVEEAKATYGLRMKGLILDLRGNPGGLLDQAVAISELFLPQGEILTTQGRHPRSRQRYRASGSDLAEGLPMVVLINGGSASAAEIVAAALQDNRRALLVGTASYGKGSVQTVVRLPNDGELTITWARMYSPLGFPLNKFGVMPSVCTSQFTGTPEELLKDLRGGSMPPGAAVAQRRAATERGESGADGLRNACPARSLDSELDLKVARQLIDEPQLYARVNTLYQVATTP
ncbi:MAG: S41 family peptidase [Proteobacteria bacterium]|nr:S41 family peptidase [Pseudomonadota bacterium]MBI3497681.1 S41 family peptidase [Pseudomonadota bacterium]